MSGRRSLLQKLALEGKGEGNFRFLVEQIEKRKITLEAAAKLLDVHPKTLHRNIEALKHKDVDRITASPVGRWEDMAEAKDWELWAETQIRDKGFFRSVVNKARENWEKVWGKKPLSALTEQDFMRARKEIEDRGIDRFNSVLALRYLVRGGFGDQKWLTKFLRTKGLKPHPRMAPELTVRDRFEQVVPKIAAELERMVVEQVQVSVQGYARTTVTSELAELVSLVVNVKRTTGIRTGKREAERELWGTRIGEGKTRILLDSEGNFQAWEVFAKLGELWTIKRTTFAGKVRSQLENFIRKRGLKQGDWLISIPRADLVRAIVTEACKRAGLTPLSLHDFRKYYGTALSLAEVPLEVAIDLNVGWKDINTLKNHYIMIRGLNADREAAKLEKFLGLEEGAPVATS